MREKDQQTLDIFSLCDEVLLYSESRHSQNATKKNFVRVPYRPSRDIKDEKPYVQLCVLAKHEQGYQKHSKTCKGCALAAKAPPIKYNPWPKTDRPWS